MISFKQMDSILCYFIVLVTDLITEFDENFEKLLDFSKVGAPNSQFSILFSVFQFQI